MSAHDDNINNINILKSLLLSEYADFDQRLTRRLGSAEFASEVLQETYLRLEAATTRIGTIQNPKAYLFRIALNIANDRRRAESRRLTVDEVDALLEIPDDRPDAAEVIEFRSEISLLQRAIAELPERRRRVLIFSRIDGLPNREIAKLLGVTVRTVEMDLKQAVEHCAERLRRPTRNKFDFPRPESSYLQRLNNRGKRLAPRLCGKALGSDKKKRPNRSLATANP